MARCGFEALSRRHRAETMGRKAMRKCDALSLTPIQERTPKKISRKVVAKASETVFSAYLNVTPSLMNRWERGDASVACGEFVGFAHSRECPRYGVDFM
jgi:DNA-binding transcriptional regulator YiaG